MLAKQVVDNFYGQLVAIWLQIHPVPDKIRLCSSHLSVNNNCRIINRLKDIRIIDENKWNDDRDELLLRSIDEDGLNWEQVGERLHLTVSCLKKRYRKLKRNR